jgi:hypothetical protein
MEKKRAGDPKDDGREREKKQGKRKQKIGEREIEKPEELELTKTWTKYL